MIATIIDIYYNKYLLQLYLYVKLFILPTHTHISIYILVYIRGFFFFNWTFMWFKNTLINER